MMTTWADQIKEEAREEGIQAGISDRIRRRVRAITSAEELTRLAAGVSQAGSLKELGLPEPRPA
jgi:hypothetical protein